MMPCNRLLLCFGATPVTKLGTSRSPSAGHHVGFGCTTVSPTVIMLLFMYSNMSSGIFVLLGNQSLPGNYLHLKPSSAYLSPRCARPYRTKGRVGALIAARFSLSRMERSAVGSVHQAGIRSLKSSSCWLFATGRRTPTALAAPARYWSSTAASQTLNSVALSLLYP
jgi:hypothetical protein